MTSVELYHTLNSLWLTLSVMNLGDGAIYVFRVEPERDSPNRMAWQWAETLVEIRVTLADIRGTTK